MKRVKYILGFGVSIVFIFSFVLLAAVWCWGNDHKFIIDIYLPAGQWNDEVFYYKQISAMVKYGIPQGYFGYNEMTAAHLTFGAWSVILLLPYYLWGKMFGWNQLSPILANLSMITISLGLFYYWVRPKVRQMLLYFVLIASMPVITRYIISGTVETLFFMAAILFAGLQRKLEKDYKNSILILYYILIGLFSLGRPYIIGFLIIPFSFWYKKNKKASVALSVLFVGVVVISYFIINKNFCAPYIVSIINSDFMDVLHDQGFLSLIVFLFSKYGMGIKDIISYVISSIHTGGLGELYLVYLITFAVLLIENIYKKCRNKQMLMAIIVSFVILSAIILLSSVNTGGRHLLMVVIYGILILCLEADTKILFGLAIMLWVIEIIIPKEEYIYQIPYQDEGIVYQNEMIKEQLQKVMLLDKEIGWKNTVDWIVDNDYSICYFIPDGFGINICFNSIEIDKLKARYVLIGNESGLLEELDENMKEIWKGNGYVLYFNNFQ